MPVVLFTVGTYAVTGWMAVQAAVVVGGIYQARQARKRMQRLQRQMAANQSSSDYAGMKVRIPSSAMARTINYGWQELDGRTAKVVGATDGQPHFFIVKALTPDHMIHAVGAILFDGVPAGPFVGDIWSDDGAWAGPGSPFYKSLVHTRTLQTIIPASGVIECEGPVREVLTIALGPQNTLPSEGLGHGYDNEQGAGTAIIADMTNRANDAAAALPAFRAGISGRTVVVPPEYRGRGLTLTYTWLENRSHVRVWCRPGSDDQTVIPRISEVAPEWNANCRLRGCVVIAAEIRPDLDVFPNGAPHITGIFECKRIHDPRSNSMVFSRNAALILRDYMLLPDFGAEPDQINSDLMLAAINQCDEMVATTDAATLEPRYCCDISLSTEDDPVDNMRLILSTMAGTATYAGAAFDIRAGVAQAGVGELSDDDLATGDNSAQPFAPALSTFSAVRGTYTRYDPKLSLFATTDAPPYVSPTYVNLSNGDTVWEDFDLPGVLSVHQAQRIQRLMLHMNWNSCSFRGVFKMKAAPYAVGQCINFTMKAFGQQAKPYVITKRSQPSSNTVDLEMVEMAAPIFNWSYREGVDPDPAPNTNLPNPNFVTPLDGLLVVSGEGVTKSGPNATIKPSMRITWNQTRDINVLINGKIQLWYKSEYQTEFTRVELPGDATRYDIEILRNEQFAIQLRAVNAVQTPSAWIYESHRTNGSVTNYLSGNLLIGSRFMPRSESDSRVSGWSDLERVGSGFSTQFRISGVRPTQEYQSDIGVATFVGMSLLTGGNSVGTQFRAFSDPVLVDVGQRLVQYVSSVGAGAQTWSILAFFDHRDELVGWGGQANGYGLDMGDQGDISWERPLRERMNIIHGYAVVPAGAASVRMVLYAVLTEHATGANNAYWFRPYLGVASEGQATLPPWAP